MSQRIAELPFRMNLKIKLLLNKKNNENDETVRK
jgi:hypothetical protein